jgi:SAM-dependent methyltransferase
MTDDPDDHAPDGPHAADAFGELLAACWVRGAVPHQVYEVLERDDGYLAITDAAHWFTTEDRWPPCEHWACDRARGRVLDIGCGSGRHALALAAKGLAVTAVDSSPGAVRTARARGVDAFIGGVGAAAGHGIGDRGQFDTMMMLGNNLGLLGNRAWAPKVLRELASTAAPGAQLLATGHDPYLTSSEVQLGYLQRNRSAGRLPGQFRVRVRYKASATDWFDYLYVSVTELVELIEESPWTLEDLDHDGAQYAVRLRLTG